MIYLAVSVMDNFIGTAPAEIYELCLKCRSCWPGYFVVAAVPVGARNIRMEELEGTGQGSFLSVTGTGKAIDPATDADADLAAELRDSDQPGELNANG